MMKPPIPLRHPSLFSRACALARSSNAHRCQALTPRLVREQVTIPRNCYTTGSSVRRPSRCTSSSSPASTTPAALSRSRARPTVRSPSPNMPAVQTRSACCGGGCGGKRVERPRGPTTAYIALGSNLGDRVGWIEKACAEMDRRGIKVKRTSSLWETEPMYVLDQDRFVNGACEVSVVLPSRFRIKLFFFTVAPSSCMGPFCVIEFELSRAELIGWSAGCDRPGTPGPS